MAKTESVCSTVFSVLRTKEESSKEDDFMPIISYIIYCLYHLDYVSICDVTQGVKI